MKCQICDAGGGKQVHNPDGTVEYFCNDCLVAIRDCGRGIDYQIAYKQAHQQCLEDKEDVTDGEIL